MRVWIKRILLVITATAGLVVVGGFSYEFLSRWSVEREHQPPGQLIDVGNQRLHLNCSGAGGPTVILEHGVTIYGSVSWVLVQPEIAKKNRVCSYDRSGYMWSDRRRPTPTGMENVKDLHLALEKAGESPPYILVGHSYGGIVMRIFAEQYPTEVSGLVFVDSSHPDQQERFGEEPPKIPWWQSAYDWTLFHSGLLRIQFNETDDKVPSEAAFAVEFLPQTAPGIGDEFSQKRAETDQQARETGPFGDTPIVVLTAELNLEPSEEERVDLAPEEIEEWLEFGKTFYQMHSEIAALSSRGVHRIVEQSGHRIPFQAPSEVVRAVHDVIATLQDDEEAASKSDGQPES